MKTYWQSFVDKYSKEIAYKSTIQILEAFYHYYDGNHKDCRKIMML